MRLKLGLGEPLHSHTQAVPGPAYRYGVLGLLPQDQASIADFGGSWKILRVKNGISGNWTGEYISAEDALAALQQEIDDNDGTLADL